MVAVGRRAEAQEVVVSTLAMAVLELLLAAVFPLQTLLMLVVQAAHVSGRPLAQLTAQAVRPALRALLVLHLLLADCLGKAAVVEAVALLAQVVQVVRAVVAQAAVVVVQHAVHTPQAPVV